MRELDKYYSSDKWMYQRGTKQIGREIKVREGIFLFYKKFDTKEGGLDITCEIEQNLVKKVTFTNGFFKSNNDKERFSDKLVGLDYDKRELVNKISRLLETFGVVIIG